MSVLPFRAEHLCFRTPFTLRYRRANGVAFGPWHHRPFGPRYRSPKAGLIRAQAAAQLLQHLTGGVGNNCAGTEDERRPVLLQKLVILGWNDAPATTMMSSRSCFFSSSTSLRQQCLVPAGQRTDAHHVHVVLDGLRAASSGVWNSGPMSTSNPRSAKAVATTLAPAVVAVLPHLGDQNTRAAAFPFFELVGHHADRFHRAGSPRTRSGTRR